METNNLQTLKNFYFWLHYWVTEHIPAYPFYGNNQNFFRYVFAQASV